MSSPYPHGRVVRASPLTLPSGQAPSQLWAGSTLLGARPLGLHPALPVPTHGLPPTSATATLGLPCSLHFFPDVLGRQYETTAGMPLRLRDWGLPGAVGGRGGDIS